MTADDAFELERQLHELEERLMGPGTRSSRRNIEELLAEEFVEIGSSGTEPSEPVPQLPLRIATSIES